MLVALKPLHDAFHVRRIVVATYQAVSGAGQRGVLQLQQEQHRHPVDNPVFPHSVARNVIPQIGVFFHDGYSKEEYKMIDETRKILGDARMRVAPTCARVPIVNCHSEAVTVEFEKPFELEAVRRILAAAPGVALTDAKDESAYPLAAMADGRDEVFVGRVRRDPSVPNGLSLWIVADNLRKGAATNAVQIAEAWAHGPAAFKVAV
jgi:aspartate-semialdehyde dehydrogenase